MEEEKGISRYVTSVINHFAGGKEGHSRLLNEIEDFIHCVEKESILYASPSGSQLGFRQESVTGKPITEIIYQHDHHIYLKYRSKSADLKPFIMYLRYNTAKGPELYEVRGKRYSINDSNSNRDILVLSARKYASKSMQALDDVVELQVEYLAATAELEALKGKRTVDYAAMTQPPSKAANLYVDNFIDGLSLMNPMETFPLLQNNLGPSGYGGASARAYHSIPYSMFSNPTDPYNSGIGLTSSANLGSYTQQTDDQRKKKRKKKANGNMFCLQCGTNQSPEWRTGPEGPKT